MPPTLFHTNAGLMLDLRTTYEESPADYITLVREHQPNVVLLSPTQKEKMVNHLIQSAIQQFRQHSTPQAQTHAASPLPHQTHSGSRSASRQATLSSQPRLSTTPVESLPLTPHIHQPAGAPPVDQTALGVFMQQPAYAQLAAQSGLSHLLNPSPYDALLRQPAFNALVTAPMITDLLQQSQLTPVVQHRSFPALMQQPGFANMMREPSFAYLMQKTPAELAVTSPAVVSFISQQADLTYAAGAQRFQQQVRAASTSHAAGPSYLSSPPPLSAHQQTDTASSSLSQFVDPDPFGGIAHEDLMAWLNTQDLSLPEDDNLEWHDAEPATASQSDDISQGAPSFDEQTETPAQWMEAHAVSTVNGLPAGLITPLAIQFSKLSGQTEVNSAAARNPGQAEQRRMQAVVINKMTTQLVQRCQAEEHLPPSSRMFLAIEAIKAFPWSRLVDADHCLATLATVSLALRNGQTRDPLVVHSILSELANVLVRPGINDPVPQPVSHAHPLTGKRVMLSPKTMLTALLGWGVDPDLQNPNDDTVFDVLKRQRKSAAGGALQKMIVEVKRELGVLNTCKQVLTSSANGLNR